ncbi:MAG: trehalase family glycosidase [Verrucomicrobiales bacterium]|nr:trehalase family glycosidase [Verrucomicrobiales bacterium]
MNFDLAHVPFSCAGAYLSFNRLTPQRARELRKTPALYLRTVHGGVDMRERELFRVELLQQGKPIPAREVASPEVLRLDGGGGHVEICFESARVIRFRGQGVGLRLSAPTAAYDHALPVGNRCMVNLFRARIQLMLTALAGSLRVRAPWRSPRSEFVRLEMTGPAWELALEEFQVAWRPPRHMPSFDLCVRSVRNDFAQWRGGAPELAAYVQWASLVGAQGQLRRPAMLMSKNWMPSVWSWDHCFNAMALARPQPNLAWDQLLIPFDHQHPSGMLPDAVNDAEVVWNFTKPPIHGWALGWMMRHSAAVTTERLEAFYPKLVRWTHWWLKHRDDDRDGVPQYNHGNDSGWDNASVFDRGLPVESPDLSAYLVVQMDTLAAIARKLGRHADADRWSARANELLTRLLHHSWRGDGFVAPRSGTHQICRAAQCLINFIPLILGQRLPKHVREKLVAGVKRHLTRHGLATEHPHSPHYQPDGYWRGPIWAPATMLLVDGLRASGAAPLAETVARRFCRTCERSGFAENFDALTGEGLRDRAYTWTASVYRLLACPQPPPAKNPGSFLAGFCVPVKGWFSRSDAPPIPRG